jgi:hypothetical protein
MKTYTDAQIERIVNPNLNHIAGVLKIKGDCGGETNWLNISASQLEKIKNILNSEASHN